MAEFCLDCYNRINHTNYKWWEVSQLNDFCEECGVYKKTIVFFWEDQLPWPFCR